MLLIGETINKSGVRPDRVSLFATLFAAVSTHVFIYLFSLSLSVPFEADAHLEIAGSRRQITGLAGAGDQQRDEN